MKRFFLLFLLPVLLFGQTPIVQTVGDPGDTLRQGIIDVENLFIIRPIADTLSKAIPNALYTFEYKLYIGTADSCYIPAASKWEAGSTVNAIKPRDGKTVEADSGKFGSLEVTGNTILDGNLTMVTTATEQVQIGTGSDAAPELSSAGDTDTGIRFTGGNKMQLVQGGLNSHTFRPYRYTMTYSDGDTLGMFLDGSNVKFVANTNGMQFGLPSVALDIKATRIDFYQDITPATNDTRSIGSLAGNKFNSLCLTDYNYIGGKGQTATQYISKENTIAGSDSSMMFRIGSDGNPYMRWTAADADSARLHVRSDSTEFYSKNALAINAPAVAINYKAVIGDSFRVAKTTELKGNTTIGSGTNWLIAADSVLTVHGRIIPGTSNFGVTKQDTIFTATFVPRWVKFTSGAKVWYSPVYADTTGKW